MTVAASPAAPPGPMSRHGWYGYVTDDNKAELVDRLLREFPIGSHVATTTKTGGWSHDLRIGRVCKIKAAEGHAHITFVTDGWVYGFLADSRIGINSRFQRGLTVEGKVPAGDPFRWIFMAIEPEIAS